jgi:hypothetical protein
MHIKLVRREREWADEKHHRWQLFAANSSRCTMCLEDFRLNERVHRLPCQHYFHHQCIVQWLLRHNTCPICRKPVQIDENPSPPPRARHRMRRNRWHQLIEFWSTFWDVLNM